VHVVDLLQICRACCEFAVDLLWTCCGCAVYDLIILYKMTSADDTDDALLACSSMYVASAAGVYLYANQKSQLKKREYRRVAHCGTHQ